MLITKIVKIKWSTSNKKWYENKGYIFTKWKDEFEVKVEDLTNMSHALVDIQCDICGKLISNVLWGNYTRSISTNKNYYCKNCKKKKELQTRLSKGKSFYDWCIENNRQDILDRWDYDLNKCNPNEILFRTTKKRYFKCPKGIHKSELKLIDSFVGEGSAECKACDSFLQWGIDNLGNDFLEKYWSDKNTLDPWIINSQANKKVWIKCQQKEYHEDYQIKCADFIRGHRCPYCSHQKIHPLDSLGQYIIDNYGKDFLNKIWSEKNKKTPFEYAPKSSKRIWWKCVNEKHNDYKRGINDSVRYNFRCPQCDYSKGEEKINNWLQNNNFIDITYEQNKLKLYQNKNIYICQKEFNGLIGLGGGNLSYDFYLPKFNLLIEYQGRQHSEYIPGFHKSKKDFEKQQEHDKRKRDYAKNHNIKLLEIWYNCFNDIEFIFDIVLKQQNNIENSQEAS